MDGEETAGRPAIEEKRDRAIYHTILADLHRMQAAMLHLQTLDNPDVADGLREYFLRERGIASGRLREWEQRRPEIYRRAGETYRRRLAEDTEPQRPPAPGG